MEHQRRRHLVGVQTKRVVLVVSFQLLQITTLLFRLCKSEECFDNVA